MARKRVLHYRPSHGTGQDQGLREGGGMKGQQRRRKESTRPPPPSLPALRGETLYLSVKFEVLMITQLGLF